MGKYDLILFDLDGTLLDTSRGIYNSVRYTERCMGFVPIPDNAISQFVGPPPKMMYKKIYNLTDEVAFQAALNHREYGKTKAIYEANLYPEIKDLLKNLKDKGYKLGVATLKLQNIAKMVLKYYGILKYFDVVVGMDTNETRNKADTIRIAKEITNTDNVVMIGDSEYDEIGAKEANVDFIAVSYGYGFQSSKNNKISLCPMQADAPLDILKFIK